MKNKSLSLLIVLIVTNTLIFGQTNYQNDKYGFRGLAPNNWKVYAEIKDDPANGIAIIDWGMPKVYSELEKASIENAVSITAYKRVEIKNLDDLKNIELQRIYDVLQSKEKIDSGPYSAYVVTTLSHGLKYKSKVVFVFKNSIGYVINFTATPGTYDINLSQFDSFLKNVSFFEPKEQSQIETKMNIQFDGLYVAKTSTMFVNDIKNDIYTYIKFTPDGTVYTQSVNSYAPANVGKWLGINGNFERKGIYKMNGAEVSFIVTNDESPDKKIEGPKKDSYSGKITDENKLYLELFIDGKSIKDYWFEFIKN